MRKLLVAVLLLALVVGAYLGYAAWSVERLKTALKNRDADAMEAIVDWPRARDSLRTDIQAFVARASAKEAAMMSPLGTMAAAAMIGSVIDNWVTPSGMRRAFSGATGDNKVRIEGVRLITATLMRGRALSEKGEPIVDFEMELGGGVWRVSRITFAPELMGDDTYLERLLKK